MIPIKIFNDSKRFTVDWTLNTLCTYKCSYCPPSLNSGSNIIKSKLEDPGLVKQFLINLHSHLQGRSVHIFLNGGEPTISPSFETIIDFCNEVGWCTYVNTNGSRTMEWWKEYAPKIFKVTVSYHPEFVDDEIFEKIKVIGDVTNVGVFTLMYPPYWKKSVEAFEKFKTYTNITLEPSRVFRREVTGLTDKSYDYTQEQLAWLTANSGLQIRGGIKSPPKNNSYGNTFVQYDTGSIEKFDEVEFVNTGKNSFNGWKCNMGLDSLFILGNGELRASACNQATTFSTISTFTGLPTDPSICRMKWCMCTTDVMIPKEL
jgi:organic radical activating enzyme